MCQHASATRALAPPSPPESGGPHAAASACGTALHAARTEAREDSCHHRLHVAHGAADAAARAGETPRSHRVSFAPRPKG
eukprot:12556778-Alexandrium_andersonii.AAC.1